jgi:Fur family peroxide stress response transcriptional regulator
MNLNAASEIVDALRAAGLKVTPQRLAIVDCIAHDETHPTAQELYERLQPRFPTMAVATVYNTLDALTGIGCCRQLHMGGSTRFDPNVAPHDHAVCERCGTIRDVASSALEAPAAIALTRAAVPDFAVQRVERIYRGVCARCATT